jgi:hypothetical protein
MKMNDILVNEDDTIKSIAGDKAVVNMDGKDVEMAATNLVPGAEPNTVTVKPTDPSEIKPGMKVAGESPTSEDQGQEALRQTSTGALLTKLAHVVKSVHTPEQLATAQKYADLMSKQISSRIAQDKGVSGVNEYLGLLHDIKHELNAKQAELGGFDETHHDLIADPKTPDHIGGDESDEFIKAVTVKPHVAGTYQAESRFFGAKDELEHFLRIAGLR